MKKIKLTEGALRRIVKESVNNVLLKEWYDVSGKYVEDWAELVEDLRVRLIGAKHGFGDYTHKHDIMYDNSQPYNKHMMKAIEYVNMALKELYQAKQDFMDESNSKQQSNQP